MYKYISYQFVSILPPHTRTQNDIKLKLKKNIKALKHFIFNALSASKKEEKNYKCLTSEYCS